MSDYIGDFMGTETVIIPITTNDGSGGRVEPSSAFEVADIRVYKGVSTTQRSSEAGYTVAAAFDSMVGVQMFSIDLTDDTDTGFFVSGNDYTVVLYPDETVDAQAVSKVIATFSIQNRNSSGGTASDVWTEVLENGLQAQEMVRIILSSAAGLVSGLPGEPQFLSNDKSKVRIRMLTDENGNRLKVLTLDGT